MPMYEDPLEEKINELISLIRVLDTKIGFLSDDVEQIKEDLIQIKFLVEEPAAAEAVANTEEDEKRWKVERF